MSGPGLIGLFFGNDSEARRPQHSRATEVLSFLGDDGPVVKVVKIAGMIFGGLLLLGIAAGLIYGSMKGVQWLHRTFTSSSKIGDKQSFKILAASVGVLGAVGAAMFYGCSGCMVSLQPFRIMAEKKEQAKPSPH